MAIAGTTRLAFYSGADPGSPTYEDLISFLGDATYVAGVGTSVAGTGATDILGITGMKGKTIVNIEHVYSTLMRYEIRFNPLDSTMRIIDLQTGAEAVNGDYHGTTFIVKVTSK